MVDDEGHGRDRDARTAGVFADEEGGQRWRGGEERVDSVLRRAKRAGAWVGGGQVGSDDRETVDVRKDEGLG
eukprot:5978899-Pleurochrysis_carterae.AAC.1